MTAVLLVRQRISYGAGFIEMVIWRLQRPVPASLHPFKYRLAYIVHGKRVVGYDNERGKGDHKHLGSCELSYLFKDPDQLVTDFMADVEKGVS